MDFLDFSRYYANHHKISYDLPRIRNVSSDDFNFVAFVDRNLKHPGRHSYGMLPFRDLSSSPYFEAAAHGETCHHDYSLNSDIDPDSDNVSIGSFEVLPSFQALINKHCDFLKSDLSALIGQQGKHVYSDFQNLCAPVFLNRFCSV